MFHLAGDDRTTSKYNVPQEKLLHDWRSFRSFYFNIPFYLPLTISFAKIVFLPIFTLCYVLHIILYYNKYYWIILFVRLQCAWFIILHSLWKMAFSVFSSTSVTQICIHVTDPLESLYSYFLPDYHENDILSTAQ